MKFGLITISCVSVSGFEMTRLLLCCSNFCHLFFFLSSNWMPYCLQIGKILDFLSLIVESCFCNYILKHWWTRVSESKTTQFLPRLDLEASVNKATCAMSSGTSKVWFSTYCHLLSRGHSLPPPEQEPQLSSVSLSCKQRWVFWCEAHSCWPADTCMGHGQLFPLWWWKSFGSPLPTSDFHEERRNLVIFVTSTSVDVWRGWSGVRERGMDCQPVT